MQSNNMGKICQGVGTWAGDRKIPDLMKLCHKIFKKDMFNQYIKLEKRKCN